MSSSRQATPLVQHDLDLPKSTEHQQAILKGLSELRQVTFLLFESVSMDSKLTKNLTSIGALYNVQLKIHSQVFLVYFKMSLLQVASTYYYNNNYA